MYKKHSKETIAGKAILCKTKKEMKTLFPKEYAAAKRMGLLDSPMFEHMPKSAPNPGSKWCNKEDVLAEAKKYPDRKIFFLKSQSCYNAAKSKGWFEDACAHMPKNKCVGKKPPRFKWDKEAVKKEALTYFNKKELRVKSAGAYDAAIKNGWIDEVCSHMEVKIRRFSDQQLIDLFKECKTKKEALTKDQSAYVSVNRRGLQNLAFAHMPKRITLSGNKSPSYKWKDEDLLIKALKYKTRIEFMEADRASYDVIYKRNLEDKAFLHMPESSVKPWKIEEIKEEALKYTDRAFFQKHNSAAYNAARRRGILDEVCSHMKRSRTISFSEKELFDLIKKIYPKAQKLKDTKVKIEGKPHIKGFEVDIYIPELRKGIEFDGKYWHSDKGLKRSRDHWPQEDIDNYAALKDGWFASKGIQILHIREEYWDLNKEACLKLCLEFLEAEDVKKSA
jgi:very-short-patch-repair endonuclease